VNALVMSPPSLRSLLFEKNEPERLIVLIEAL